MDNKSYIEGCIGLRTTNKGSKWHPTFIGIGAEKSATTWCWRVLDEHPDVCVSHPKELNYFNDNYVRGETWYRKHFAETEKLVTGEINPVYMYDPEAAKRIARDCSGTRILAVLRNPYGRALSHLVDVSQDQLGRISNLRLADAKRLARDESKYIRNSLYYQALAPYFELFDHDQITILFYDDLTYDPVAFLRALYTCVGVRPDFLPSTVVTPVNKTQDYRSVVLFKILRSMSHLAKLTPVAKGSLEWLQRNGLREWVLNHIQIDRGRPILHFNDVFGAESRHIIAEDVANLVSQLQVQVPPAWELSDDIDRNVSAGSLLQLNGGTRTPQSG